MDTSISDSREDESGPEIRCKKQKLTIVLKSKYTYLSSNKNISLFITIDVMLNLCGFLQVLHPYIRNPSKGYYTICIYS